MFNFSWDGFGSVIADIYVGIFSCLDGVYEMAIKSPSEFNPEIWNAVRTFNENAVLPVAWSVLTLFLLLELANVFKRADVRGIESIYYVLNIVLKMAIAKLMMENMMVIIDMIFEVVAVIVGNGFSLQLSVTPNVRDIQNAIDSLSVLEVFSLFFISLIARLVSLVCGLLANIVVQLRFIEIYAFTSIAALPFATLPSQEYSNIGKDFIKRMVALAIHVVFIIFVLFCYSALLRGANVTLNPSAIDDSLMSGLGYSILVVLALFQTGGWAKQLLRV